MTAQATAQNVSNIDAALAAELNAQFNAERDAAQPFVDLLNQIRKEGAQIGKSLARIRSTVQGWLTAVESFERDSAMIIIGEVLEISNGWHGVNTASLLATIQDSTDGINVRVAPDGAIKMQAKGKAKDYTFKVSRNWWEPRVSTAAKKSLEVDKEVEKLIKKLLKDGKKPAELYAFFTKPIVNKVVDSLDAE